MHGLPLRLLLPALLGSLVFSLASCGDDPVSNPGGGTDTTAHTDTSCKVNCKPPIDTSCKVNCVFTPGTAGVAPYTPLTAQQISDAIDSFGQGDRKSFFGMRKISSKGKTFLMGVKDSVWPEDIWAYPQHRVGFSYDYYMERTELTVAEFCRVMNWAANLALVHVKIENGGRWIETTGANPQILCTLVPENPGTTDRRVTTDGASFSPYDPFWNRSMDRVTIAGAKLYSNFRSRMIGLEPVYDSVSLKSDFRKNGYRLPTEAEYEFAMRAGTTSEYLWGTDEVLPEFQRAYIRSNLAMSSVGLNQPNEWGLYDMIGGESVWLEGRLTEPLRRPQPASIDLVNGADTGRVACYFGDSRSGGRKYCVPETVNSLRLVLPLRP